MNTRLRALCDEADAAAVAHRADPGRQPAGAMSKCASRQLD
jgi:hypothetical protein